MEEVRIHSGSRIKLVRIHEADIPAEFLSALRAFAGKEARIDAVFMFGLQPEGQNEQTSMALSIKGKLFSRKDESFLEIVDQIQLLLPEDMPINLYRFGASEFLAKYCLDNLEPIFVRTPNWLDKQRKKLG